MNQTLFSSELCQEIRKNPNDFQLEEEFIKIYNNSTMKKTIKYTYFSFFDLIQKMSQTIEISIYGSNIFISCKLGNINGVRWFIEKQNVDKNTKVEITDISQSFFKDDTPIHVACENGHVEIVQYLIEKHNVDSDLMGYNGKTPLHCACENGHLQIAEYLISKGANINVRDNNNDNILHASSKGGLLTIVQYLVEKQNLNPNEINLNGKIPLSYAASNHHQEIIKYLLPISNKFELCKDQDNKSAFKILLLGAGEVGKSTIFRHLQVLCDDCIQNRDSYIYPIRQNILIELQKIAKYIRTQNLSFDNKLELYLEKIKYDDPYENDTLKYLCKHPKIIELLHNYEIPDQLENIDFFFQNIDRILNNDYTPTNDDILMGRFRTIDVSKICFHNIGANTNVALYDIGGQRSERKKWKEAFESVNSIMFIISLNDFDRTIFEDNTIGRLQDSYELLQNILKTKQFENVNFYLIFNKYTLFKNKIENTDKFAKMYPNFTGNIHDVQQCAQFIIDQFLDIFKKLNRKVTEFTIDALNPGDVFNMMTKIHTLILRSPL